MLEGRLSDQNCMLQHNHSLVLHHPPILLSRPESQPTAIPSLGGWPPPRLSKYKLSVCKDPILPLPPPKPHDMPIDDTVVQAYQQPKTEDEPFNVYATEPDLNTNFEEKTHNRKGSSMRYLRDQERNTYRKQNCPHSKNLCTGIYLSR